MDRFPNKPEDTSAIAIEAFLPRVVEVAPIDAITFKHSNTLTAALVAVLAAAAAAEERGVDVTP
jgi:hypothetical protein